MLPTDTLKEEHKVIERMLKVMEAISDRLEKEEDISPDVFENVIDFIQTFADRCHHAKEEDLLFDLAISRGIPKRGSPIGVMLFEHDQGRNFVKGMVQALEEYIKGNKSVRSSLAENARGYAELLSQHIEKENYILYPMINNVLTEDDQKELLEKFEEVEHEQIGEEKHHQYIDLVERLEKEFIKAH